MERNSKRLGHDYEIIFYRPLKYRYFVLQAAFVVLASACAVFGAPQGAYYAPSAAATTPIPIIAQTQELNLDGSYQYR